MENCGRMVLQAVVVAQWCCVGLLLAREQPARFFPDNFRVRQWNEADGLPDRTVRGILQTRDGYLWIGTPYGLARYDGLRFTIFNHGNTPEMVDDHCTSLVEDQQGNLWVGTRNGPLRFGDGVTRFNLLTGEPQEEHIRVAAHEMVVYAVHCDAQGRIWAGTEAGGFRLEFGRFVPVGREGPEPVAFKVNLIKEDATGRLWMGTDHGPARLGTDDRTFGLPGLELVPPQERSVTAMETTVDGTLLAMMRRPGHNPDTVYRFQDGTWVRAWDRDQRDFAPLFKDRSGTLWLQEFNVGLLNFRNGQFSPSLPFPPPSVGFLSLAQDHEDNLWSGADRAGMLQLQPRRIEVYGPGEGLAHPNSWTICEGRDGAVWIGTDGGVSRLQAGRMTHYTTANGLLRNDARAIIEDGQGRIWIGTGGTLATIDGEAIENVSLGDDWVDNKIRALHAGRDGSVWVGTIRGVHRLQGDLRQSWFTDRGNEAPDVRVILEDRSGRVWLGTYGQGLHLLEDGVITRCFVTTNGLPSNFVWALHEDSSGRLWIGSDRGLARYDGSRFARFDTHHGLPDNLVNHILEDDFGDLWISHDRGIYRVAMAQLDDVAADRQRIVEAISYGEEDGMPSNETNGQKSQPAGWKTRDGRLWFPTTKGVVVFDPANLPDNPHAPRVVIEQVRANGRVIFDNQENYRSTPRGSGAGSLLELAPGSAHILEFTFTGITFTAADQVQFRYRLSGVDPDWIEAGMARQAYYSNFRPGDYTFEVRARNKYGVWSSQAAILDLDYVPYYYQTRWFAFLVGITLVGVILGLYQWRMIQVRRIQRLEQQMARFQERERLARDLHDGLGASLTHLRMLTDFNEAKEGSAEHGSQLVRATQEALQALKEITWAANPATDTLEELTSRIAHYAETFLASAGIRCRLDLPDTLPELRFSPDQKQALFYASKETLNNVVKHAHATEISLRVTVDGEWVKFNITDNGVGFEPAVTRGRASFQGGAGLPNLLQRIESSGGRFHLSAEPGKGTAVEWRIPIHPS